jgi:hypothetical protein
MNGVPEPKTFFLEAAPYEQFVGTGQHVDVLRLQFYTGTLDTYCVDCEKESVFQSNAPKLHGVTGRVTQAPEMTVDELVEQNVPALFPMDVGLAGAGERMVLSGMEKQVLARRLFVVPFTCTRDDRHTICFIVRVDDGVVCKIGQWPSVADLKTPGIKKYQKALDKERYRELSRAIGLRAHGVGIGAFVYLRRIFEDLIEEAHQNARSKAGWDENDFVRGRMDEKVLAVAGELPDVVVESRGIYAILSKGIHDLTEAECLTLFEPIEQAIEVILDAKLEAKEREEKRAKIVKSVGAMKGELGSGK